MTSRPSEIHFHAHLADRLQQWKDAGLERTPWEFASAQTPVARIDGRDFLLFSSSNYLGLSTHPRVVAASESALHKYGTGSGGSRLTTGTTALHHEVENFISSWLNYGSATYYATGYQANVGVLSALADARTTVFSDEKNHASIIDGCRLSRARTVVYPHRDPAALADQLAHRDTPFALVVTDGLFSMDATTAPVAELAKVAHAHGAWLMVDEAHSLGVLGDTGRGCLEAEGLLDPSVQDRPDLIVGTASKALGSEGGFVCSTPTVGALLKNQSRSYVYSTSNSAPVMAATLEALKILGEEPRWRRELKNNIEQLIRGLEAQGIPHPGLGHHSPIVPIWVGDEAWAMELATQLREEGVHVPAMRYPTVPRGQAMLRVTVMATHTPEQIKRLISLIARYWVPRASVAPAAETPAD